jgi:hypothetical protein
MNVILRALQETFRISDTVVRAWRLFLRHRMFLIVAALGSVWIRVLRLAWPSIIRLFFSVDWPLALLDFLTVREHQVFLAIIWVRDVAFLSTVEAFASALICYSAFCDLRGLKPTLKDALAATSRRLVPVVGLSPISNVAWDLGFHLFVVPGLLAGIVLCVSMPACLIEKTGAFESIGRSFALVRSHLWPILGVVGFWQLLLQTIYRMIQANIHNWRLSMLAIWLVVIAATAINATFSAVLYHDLCAEREDSSPENKATNDLGFEQL